MASHRHGGPPSKISRSNGAVCVYWGKIALSAGARVRERLIV
jgi:hypothetical protein